MRRPSRLFWITCLVLIFAVGALARIWRLEHRSIAHPEMYVPGIHLPEGLAEPHARLTLKQVLSGTFSSDVHPPGYYVLMWGWTKMFGADPRSIRLPAAIFGVFCIPLIVWVGILIAQRMAGWIAAASFALSGYEIFWSRSARMFSEACFLGLASTVALLLLSSSQLSHRQRMLLSAVYAICVLAGLATHIFFWPVFFAQIAWIAWAARGGGFPGLLKLQLLIAITGSPLIAFAGYQSGRESIVLGNEVCQYLSGFVAFAFLLPDRLSGFFQSPPVFWSTHWVFALARLGFLLVSIALFKAGCLRLAQRTHAAPQLSFRGPGPTHYFPAAFCAVAAICGFVFTAKLSGQPIAPSIRITQILIALPLLLTAGACLVERCWHAGVPRPAASPGGLVIVTAVLPIILLCGISLIRPVLNQRGLMIVTPYVLLVLGAGITSVIRRRPAIVMLALVLIPAHFMSIRTYHRMLMDPADYKAFAARLEGQIRPDDLVFLEKKWNTTPVLYYLDSRQYRMVASDYSQACRRHPVPRVWALGTYQDALPSAMKQALQGFAVQQVIEVPYARAVLFVRNSNGPQ